MACDGEYISSRLGDDAYVMGVNTGTSGDAVDVIAMMIRDDGYLVLDAMQHPFSEPLSVCVQRVLNQAHLSWSEYAFLERALSEHMVEAVGLLHDRLSERGRCGLIACHGQTLSYRAEDLFTHQLMNPYPLLIRFGCPVAYDFRRWDMASGGRGAPLIPLFHRYLCQVHQKTSYAFLNIGGIANVTVVTEASTVGYDVGPGCCLMDEWYRRHHQTPMRDGGLWAEQGQVLRSLLERWLSDPVLAAPPPKAMAREYFTQDWLNGLEGYAPEDVQRTLLELTATLIVKEIKRHQLKAFCCFGGGRYIRPLMEALAVHACVEDAEQFGLHPQSMEPALFAWLGWMRWHHRVHSQLPTITGGQPSKLGTICLP